MRVIVVAFNVLDVIMYPFNVQYPPTSLGSNFQTPSACDKELQLKKIITPNLQLQTSQNCHLLV